MNKPRDQKPHIGIFGRRNTGKSSLVNTLAQQDIAIVSEQAGSTTDPVKKSIEIFGIGPVILIDTAGIDDRGELGQKRVQKTLETLKHIDLAILTVTDNLWSGFEDDLIRQFKDFDLPYITIYTKSDISTPNTELQPKIDILFSSISKNGMDTLVEKMRALIPESAYRRPSFLESIIKENDSVLMITPIDGEAPEGRLILPQVQVLRDILDCRAIATVIQETQLPTLLKQNFKPDLVITDSQIFGDVARQLPSHIPLTGFSILLASLHPYFKTYLKYTPYISNLKDGDTVLILESCTHLTSCEDIGRYKIPDWLKKFTGKDLHFEFSAGLTPIDSLKNYQFVIQCGGCMLTRKQLKSRLKPIIEAQIPMSNYGLCIAYMNGIFERATAVFGLEDKENEK